MFFTGARENITGNAYENVLVGHNTARGAARHSVAVGWAAGWQGVGYAPIAIGNYALERYSLGGGNKHWRK